MKIIILIAVFILTSLFAGNSTTLENNNSNNDYCADYWDYADMKESLVNEAFNEDENFDI